MRLLRLLLLPVMLMCMAAAPDPGEQLGDPAKEARARALMHEFRCVVCQNESIDDSEADLARDLRRIVRDQVAAGRSDAEVRSFMVARYGEFVLLRPSFDAGNAVLWLTPVVLVAAAALVLFLNRRRSAGLEPPLTEEEESKLAQLSAGEDVDTIRTNIRRGKTGPLTET